MVMKLRRRRAALALKPDVAALVECIARRRHDEEAVTEPIEMAEGLQLIERKTALVRSERSARRSSAS
jgi:hypothetical protein